MQTRTLWRLCLILHLACIGEWLTREPTVEPGGAAPLEISYRAGASPYCHFLLFLDLALRRAVLAADAKMKEKLRRENRTQERAPCTHKSVLPDTFQCLS